MRRTLVAGLVAGLVVSLLAQPAVAEPITHQWPTIPPAGWPVEATLTGRAQFDADYLAPGPASGAKASPGNGRKGPWPGQVIPGFSGMVDQGDGTFLALPDNGFGTKANSADFLLRIYRIIPQWETRDGGPGTITVGDFIQLKDPNKKIAWPIVNNDAPARELTGADFDVESIQKMADGTLWIGEEFGPYLLHFAADGTLLDAPVPFVDGKSPSSPELKPGETPNVGSSRGFEAMALGRDGRHLYPIVEGALANDPIKSRRWIYEFDTATTTYTGKKWAYRTHLDANVIGDAFMNESGKLELIERDDFDGPRSVIKRLYEVDLNQIDADSFASATLIMDFLKIRNPGHIGMGKDGQAYGVGEQFSFPVQSLETILRLKNGSYVSVNDNNYPSNAARYPGKPDNVEMIRFTMDRRMVHGNAATIIGHRGASGYRPEHTLSSYELAIQQCVDFIEPDVVPTTPDFSEFWKAVVPALRGYSGPEGVPSFGEAVVPVLRAITSAFGGPNTQHSEHDRLHRVRRPEPTCSVAPSHGSKVTHSPMHQLF